MRKKTNIKQIMPLFYKECFSCDESVKFEKMWCLKVGIGKAKKNVFLCSNCCKDYSDAEERRIMLHSKILNEMS